MKNAARTLAFAATLLFAATAIADKFDDAVGGQKISYKAIDAK